MEDDYREAARRRHKERSQSAWYKLEGSTEGTENTFRVLRPPPTKKYKRPWIEYAIHRDVGPEKRTVRCGKTVPQREGHCWLCDVKIPALRKAGREARAQKLEPQDQFVVQVAKVETDDENKPRFSGPFIFGAPKKVADTLLNMFASPKRDILSHKKAYNMNVTRKGISWNKTRYPTIMPDIDPSKVPDKIVAKLKPFEELKEIQLYSEARQKAAYTGDDYEEEERHVRTKKRSREEDEEVDDHEEEEEEEDEEPPKKKKKRVIEEDEEEDESDDEEESESDEEEEEEPTPKKKKKHIVEDEEEEEEEEDEEPPKKKKKRVIEEDEEEEEEPPKKKKKKVVEEDEDDDEGFTDDSDEEESEEEDEEPPKKKKKRIVEEEEEEEDEEPPKKKKKVAPSDDEEDEPDEDPDLDEDEEPPAPKKKKVKKVVKKRRLG